MYVCIIKCCVLTVFVLYTLTNAHASNFASTSTAVETEKKTETKKEKKTRKEKKSRIKTKKKKIKYTKSREAIPALIRLTKERKKMINILNLETKNYSKVKEAYDSGDLKKGDEASKIVDKYGRPGIVLKEQDGEISRWVYKAGNKTYFEGGKISLFFDSGDKLISWEETPPIGKVPAKK